MIGNCKYCGVTMEYDEDTGHLRLIGLPAPGCLCEMAGIMRNLKVTITTKEGTVLDTKNFKSDSQHFSLVETDQGYVNHYSIADLDVGTEDE